MSESVKKARQVYCAKQPKPRYHSAGVTLGGRGGTAQTTVNQNSSNSSSVTSLKCGSNEVDEISSSLQQSKTEVSNKNSNQQNNNGNNHSRTMSLSPMKRSINKTSKSPSTVNQKGHQSLKNGGPKIAKPVIKPQLKISATNSMRNNITTSHNRPEQSSRRENIYNKSSKLPVPPSTSSISSGAASPAVPNAFAGSKISRIPQPGNSQSPMKKSRIPSAPRYNPPQRKVVEDVSRENNLTPSPPPPPPPTQMMEQEECRVTNIAVGRCSPSSTPTPTPPESPHLIEHGRSVKHKPNIENEEEDDDILCVHPDGQVEIRPSSSSRASTSTPSMVNQQLYNNRNSYVSRNTDDVLSQTNLSPWKPVPEPSNYQPPTYSTKKFQSSNTQNENKIKHEQGNINEDSSGYSGGENASSADDEGSRDGEDEEVEGRRRSVSSGTRYSLKSDTCPEKIDNVETNDSGILSSASSTTPPKKTESQKQGVAARRIQRTWKHFYQEVCYCLFRNISFDSFWKYFTGGSKLKFMRAIYK